jgi:hypothetical protein
MRGPCQAHEQGDQGTQAQAQQAQDDGVPEPLEKEDGIIEVEAILNVLRHRRSLRIDLA